MTQKIRLQKVLAEAGVASRRVCEEIILEGRVDVNGEQVNSLPIFVDPGADTIKVDGKKVKIRPLAKVYLMLNKPKGVVSTAKDDRGRRTVLHYVPAELAQVRLFPVGRLDIDSQGLILLTNDGELTKKLTHPRYGVKRVYSAEVGGHVDGKIVEQLLRGVWLAEGKAKASAVKIIHRGSGRSVLEITLHEGKNRQIRRMCAKIDLPIKKLTRICMGNLELRGIGVGKIRLLNKDEIRNLKKLVNQK